MKDIVKELQDIRKELSRDVVMLKHSADGLREKQNKITDRIAQLDDVLSEIGHLVGEVIEAERNDT